MSHPSGVIVGVGAENGLGAALCRRFAREGYHILVAGRTSEKIERVVLSIRETGGSAEAVETDNHTRRGCGPPIRSGDVARRGPGTG